MDDGDLLGSKRKIHNCETLSLTLTRRPLRENSWVRRLCTLIGATISDFDGASAFSAGFVMLI